MPLYCISVVLTPPCFEEGTFAAVGLYWFDLVVAPGCGVRGGCGLLLGSFVRYVVRHNAAVWSGVGQVPSVVVTIEVEFRVGVRHAAG